MRGEWDRRTTMSALLGAGLAALGGERTAFAARGSGRIALRTIAAEKGIVFGAEIGGSAPGSHGTAFTDPAYRALVARECAIIVPENEMKLYAIDRPDGSRDFAAADRIADFAAANDLKLRGHTLLYNRDEFIPADVRARLDGLSAGQVGDWLHDYVAQVASRYAGRIGSWDVVNETVDPDTGELRATAFSRVLGFDALRIAYEAAGEAAPGAQRVYNDYMSWGTGSERHRKGVLALLADFRKRGVPVDALGIQSHIGAEGRGMSDADRRAWRAFVDEVVAMDYAILITEFDVNDKGIDGAIDVRDRVIADIASDYLDLMLPYPQLKQFLCWGLVDRYSWLHGFAPRPDGLPQRGTPFDDRYRPKPLYQAIAKALQAAPKR